MAVRRRKSSDYAVISLRIKEPLRAKVERAAKRNGTSMNSEIAGRLERSFVEDEYRDEALFDAFGGVEAYYLLRLAGAAAAVEQAHAGKPWPRDPRVFDNALQAINTVFCAFRPRGRKKPVDAFTDARAAKLMRNALVHGYGFPPTDADNFKLETDLDTIRAVKAKGKN